MASTDVLSEGPLGNIERQILTALKRLYLQDDETVDPTALIAPTLQLFLSCLRHICRESPVSDPSIDQLMASTQSVLQKDPYAPNPTTNNAGSRSGKLPTPTSSEPETPEKTTESDGATTTSDGFTSGESSTAASHQGSKQTTPHPSPSSISSTTVSSVHDKPESSECSESQLIRNDPVDEDGFQSSTASVVVTTHDGTPHPSSPAGRSETVKLVNGGGDKDAQFSEAITFTTTQLRGIEKSSGQAVVRSSSKGPTAGEKRKLVAERTRENDNGSDGDGVGDQDTSGDEESAAGRNAKTRSRQRRKTKQSVPTTKRQKTFTYKHRDVPAAAKTPRRREPPKPAPTPKPLRSKDREPTGVNISALFTEKEFAMLAQAHGDRLSPEQLADLEDEDGVPVTENQWSAFDSLVGQLEEQDLLKTQTTDKVWRVVGALTVRPQFSSTDPDAPISSRLIETLIQTTELQEGKGGSYRLDKWFNLTVSKSAEPRSLAEFLQMSHSDPLTLEDFEEYWLGAREARIYPDLHLDHQLATDIGVIPRTSVLRGNELLELLKPVNGPALLIGEKGSIIPMHLEVEELYSVHYQHKGYRTWTIVPPSQRALLEDFFEWLFYKNTGYHPRCSQFIYHLNVYITPATLHALGVDYYLMTQSPGQAIITRPGTYAQTFNATASICERSLYAKKWLPESWSFCPSDCAAFYPEVPDWQPQNLICSRLNPGMLQINPFEAIEISTMFRVQSELADQKPIVADSTKKPEAKHTIGGREAQRYTHLITRFADCDTVRQLNQILSGDHYGEPTFTHFDNSWSPVYAYRRFCQARNMLFQGGLNKRFAALNLARAIDEHHKAYQSMRMHRAACHMPTVPEIIKTKSKEVTNELTMEEKTAQFGHTKFEVVVDLIEKDIKELYRLGSTLKPISDLLGDRALLLIPTVDVPVYNTMHARNLRLLLKYLMILRPRLKEILGNPRTFEELRLSVYK